MQSIIPHQPGDSIKDFNAKYLPTVILRHRKENLKKCSLRGLETREDFRFFTYPIDTLPSLQGYILLKVDAPPLTIEDVTCGLFVIDATWRYAQVMEKQIAPYIQNTIHRSIPRHYRTAYPRRQEDCPDPGSGLASIEAIYAAYLELGRDTAGLLDNYYWREEFLKMKHSRL